MMLISLFLSFLNLADAVVFNLTSVNGQLTNDSLLLRSLRPVSDPTFDFSIDSLFHQRNGNNNYHTGDVSIKYRRGNTAWSTISTAANRKAILSQLPVSQSTIATTDLSSIFHNAGLNVTRIWADHNGDLVLIFNFTNLESTPIELGGLSFPLEVDNIFTQRTPEFVQQYCSFIDPYIGLDAGYAQVRRLTGTGPNMVITPFIAGTHFEGWQFLSESKAQPLKYQSTTYEGGYGWVVHTKAYVEDEWADAQPWNNPSSRILTPNETASYGLRFTIVPSVSEIESTVSSLGFPVAIGIPGYIIPKDTVGRLYLNLTARPSSISATPIDALQFTELAVPPSTWIGYSVTASDFAFGRVRVSITYSDGRTQTLHYWVTENSTAIVDRLGEHASAKQWFTDASDPFKRAPSIMSFNNETDDLVLQEGRAWIPGLSDEGGAGSFVLMAMKQTMNPVTAEINQLEEFVEKTVWGGLQYSTGDNTNGVKKSLFYYDPETMVNFTYDPFINWQGTWNQTAATHTNRTYDYVWVSLLYWALYKASRVQPGIITRKDPTWYLQKAGETVNFAFRNNTSGLPNTLYTDLGLMGESVWESLLGDLRFEDMGGLAIALEEIFRKRQAMWANSTDPFGSEAPWDCTGQEGVYTWSQYFNDSATAARVINSIHGFDLTVPHWGYNGNARRYWDFETAGNPKLAGIERLIHHYGSSLNAISLLDYYRRSSEPSSRDSFYNLRVGYGGSMAPLSNIDGNGFGAMAFHSYPETLAWDSYTGDYGPSFVGHYQTSGSYLVQHPDFGWVTFGGNLAVDSAKSTVTVYPVDSLRRRAYVAPLGLYVVIESGRIDSYTWDYSKKVLEMVFKPLSNKAQETIFWFEQTSSVALGRMVLQTDGLTPSRGGLILHIPPPGSTITWSLLERV
ncbi:hypothetical protein BDV39DRAFT_204480 [Aspergillus sergii]|uniref:Six-hairpin glycosidase-like protein n=1 Tax=Aspergillus sergii TaxID=1034303 RepID=A0A5N6X7G8_9EURO|nr:hypothetical protein BDV39DRAFT_204480 [Aspergillus sergii]